MRIVKASKMPELSHEQKLEKAMIALMFAQSTIHNEFCSSKCPSEAHHWAKFLERFNHTSLDFFKSRLDEAQCE